MSSHDVESVACLGVVENGLVNVFGEVDGFRGYYLTLDKVPVLADELRHFLSCPDAALVRSVPVRLVLYGHGVDGHSLAFHVLVVVVEKVCPVGIVLLEQFAAVAVAAVRLPFSRGRPWRCEYECTVAFCGLCVGHARAPSALVVGDVESYDVQSQLRVRLAEKGVHLCVVEPVSPLRTR